MTVKFLQVCEARIQCLRYLSIKSLLAGSSSLYLFQCLRLRSQKRMKTHLIKFLIFINLFFFIKKTLLSRNQMRNLICIFSLKEIHKEWNLTIFIVCRNFHLKRLIHMKFMTKTTNLISKIKLLHFKRKSKINLLKIRKSFLIGINKINWEIQRKAKNYNPL